MFIGAANLRKAGKNHGQVLVLQLFCPEIQFLHHCNHGHHQDNLGVAVSDAHGERTNAPSAVAVGKLALDVANGALVAMLQEFRKVNLHLRVRRKICRVSVSFKRLKLQNCSN